MGTPGRPSEYTEELAQIICEKMAGGMTLKRICEEVEGMPTRQTVYNWLVAHPSFFDAYTRARDIRLDNMAEELEEIADDGSNDWMKNKFGEEVLNADHVARSRLRIETKKWILAKLKPRTYGEKIAIGGAEDLPPIQTQQAATVDLSGLSLEQLDALETVMRQAGGKLPREIEEAEIVDEED